MANARARSVRFSDADSSASQSRDSEYVTATASLPAFFSARSRVEEQIERSKRHWSERAQVDSVDVDVEDEEAVAADNVKVFRTLQEHPEWGKFFRTFGGGEDDQGELVMGERFAKGGQAEIFHSQIKWQNPMINMIDVQEKIKWVLKVFAKGTLLRHLQLQWPQGFLQFKASSFYSDLSNILPRCYCDVVIGTLLKDGRFAFLMVAEYEDLRSYIDRRMLVGSFNGRPFSKIDEEWIMYHIAFGMDRLQSHNIVHRDLKASNVLMGYMHKKGSEDMPNFGDCSMEIAGTLVPHVADFECSLGVIGTGFFRAPEILKACKNKNVSQRPELFTEHSDVYSYGMTCYEVLTGKIPFENYSKGNYDLVLDGQRPEIPEDVDDWVHDLISRCWQTNPEARPTFKEILNILEASSETAKICKIGIQESIAFWSKSQDET